MPSHRLSALFVTLSIVVLVAGCVTVPPTTLPAAALPATAVPPTAESQPTISPSATPEPTSAPTTTAVAASYTAEKILEQNAVAEADLKTARAVMDMVITAGAQTVEMTIETATENPDRAYARAETMGALMETMTLDAGKNIFMRAPGSETWVKVNAEATGMAVQAAPAITEFARSPRLEGEEVVDGADSYVIAFDIDMAQFFESDPTMSALFNPLSTTASGKSWIGKEDMLTRKAFLEMKMTGAAGDISLAMEIAAGDFDQPIEFPEPSPYIEQIPLRVGDPVFEVAFSPDGRTLAACDDDMLIYLWDVNDHAADPVLIKHPDLVKEDAEPGASMIQTADFYSLAFSPDGKTLVAGSQGAVYLYDLTDLEAEPVELPVSTDAEGLGQNNAVAVAYSPDGKFLAAGGSSLPVHIWDAENLDAAPVTLEAPAAEYMDLLFTPDSKTLIYGGGEGKVLLWALDDLTAAPQVISGHEGLVYSLDLTADGHTLLTVGYNDPVRAWSLDRPDARPEILIPRQMPEISKAPTLALDLSPDEEKLATADVFGTVRLWPAADPELPFATLQGHGEYDILSIAFSPDGKYLASGGGDALVNLWVLQP